MAKVPRLLPYQHFFKASTHSEMLMELYSNIQKSNFQQLKSVELEAVNAIIKTQDMKNGYLMIPVFTGGREGEILPRINKSPDIVSYLSHQTLKLYSKLNC